MKRVLFVSYLFPPLGGGGVYRTVKFTRYLPDLGWQPIVLTVKNPIHWAEDTSLLDELPKDLKIYRTVSFEPFPLHILFSKLGLGKPFDYIVSKILPIDQRVGWVPHSILKGRKIIEKEGIDIIYTTSPPHSSHLIGFYLKMWTKRPWVADFRDPWTQAATYHPRGTLQKRLDEYAERKVLNYCDLVIANTEGNRLSLIERYNLNPQKVVTITNGYDGEEFVGIERRSTEERFTITYTGSFYQDYSPLPFIKGMKMFLAKRPELKDRIRLCFIGKMDEYRDEIKDGLKGVVEFKDYLPHREAIKYMVNSHLLLLLLPSKPGAETWYPGKIFEYMASGTPVLALVPDGLAKRLIEESRTGFVVNPEDVDAISERIYELYRRWERGELTTNPDWKVIKRYERKGLTKALAEEFDRVLYKTT